MSKTGGHHAQKFQKEGHKVNIKPFRISAALVVALLVSVVLAACGSSDTAAVPPQDAESSQVASVVAAVDNTTTVNAGTGDAQASVSAPEEPSGANSEKPAEAAVDSDSTVSIETGPVDEQATAEVVQTEVEAGTEATEKALLTSYSDFGFSLKLDRGAEVQSTGWTESEPSVTQGLIAFSYGGVNTNLVWGPPEDRTALTFLADTYNILKASQPAVTFESISDGEVSVSEQEGVYGGFKAVDASGVAVGGGLIGAWVCGDNDTAFRMTLTGEDATIVRLRFDRLLENFACTSS